MAMGARDVLNMSGTIPEAVVFGPFRFIPGDGLWRDGQAVPLPPRALGVLTTLLTTPGTVVSKQALMDAVWPDTFVTESSLLEAIGLIRGVLGDDRRNPTYIQTVHRRGYRFIGRVGARPEAPPAPFFSGPEWRPIVAACVSYVIATVGVAIVFALLGHPRPAPVMPEARSASPGFAISHTGRVVYVPERGAPIAPAWTPEGLELALAFSRTGPFTVLTDINALVAQAGGQFPTSWSPDHRQLAYTEFQPMTGADIWVLDAQTGTRRPLARTAYDETWARFSPDGRSIAYMSNESGRWEVYVLGVSGGGRRVRVSADGGAWPSWSRDGATVYFSAEDGARRPRRAELRVVLEWFSELTKQPS
jgi:DNA-binding winged helix-turn-helix (wHTH) protein